MRFHRRGILGVMMAAMLVLAGGECCQAEEDEALVAEVQIYLNENGYDCGMVDGLMGEITSEAISSLQRDHGLSVTGDISDELVAYIRGEITITPTPQVQEGELVDMVAVSDMPTRGNMVDMASSGNAVDMRSSDDAADEDADEEIDDDTADMEDSFVFREGVGGESALNISFNGPYTPEECKELAVVSYAADHGFLPECEVTVFENTGVVTLHLYREQDGEIITLDWYTVDPKTGKGTNMATEEVDLSLAAKQYGTEEDSEDESIEVSSVFGLLPEEAASALGFSYSESWVSTYGDHGMSWYKEEGSGTDLFYYVSRREEPGAFSLEVTEEGYHLYDLEVGATREEVAASMESHGFIMRDQTVATEVFVDVNGQTVTADYADGFVIRWYYDGTSEVGVG